MQETVSSLARGTIFKASCYIYSNVAYFKENEPKIHKSKLYIHINKYIYLNVGTYSVNIISSLALHCFKEQFPAQLKLYSTRKSLEVLYTVILFPHSQLAVLPLKKVQYAMKQVGLESLVFPSYFANSSKTSWNLEQYLLEKKTILPAKKKFQVLFSHHISLHIKYYSSQSSEFYSLRSNKPKIYRQT